MNLQYMILHVLFVYVRVKPSTAGVEYVFGHERTDYWTAAALCANNGMQIVTARNVTEMTNVKNYLEFATTSNYGVWLGLTLGDSTTNPQYYTWVDNSLISWSKWAPQRESYEQEPNHRLYDKCVVMFGSRRYWYTQRCSYQYLFVCQRFADVPTTRPPPVIPDMPTIEGLHFHRQRNLRPTGPKLKHTWARSWSECAKICQRTKNCDVLHRDPGGNCTLYNSEDTTLDQDVSTSRRTYIRRYEQMH